MRTTNTASWVRIAFTCALVASAASSLAVEKSSEQVSPFVGSFGYSVPIEVPAFHGLEPQLGLAYTSEGRNGFVGVGWTLSGFGLIERTNAGGGTARFDAQDVFTLGGGKLVACSAYLSSPSCNTGGTHTTEVESFTRVRFDATTNTWTVWAKNGVRTIFSPLLTAAGGTYRWGQSAVVDPLGNSVTYAWTCTHDCYPSSVGYGPYQVTLYREARPDVISFARGADLGRTSERLRSVVVTLVGGDVIRGYKLTYTMSALTGRSLLASVQQYGRDLIHDSEGAFTGGSTLPPHTFSYTADAQGRVFVAASEAPPTPPATTEAVAWAERENVTPIGDGSSLQKSGGTQNTWDALASSTRALSFGDGFVEVTAGNEPGKRFGLSRKVKDFTPDEIDFSFLESNSGSGHVAMAYHKGTLLGTWPASPGSLLRIEINAGVVRFEIDGVVVHTLTSARITYPLVAAASLAFNGAVLHSARVSGALQDASSWCWGEGLLTGDFDGDGRTDQACFTNFTTGPGTSTPTLRVRLSTGDGFGAPVVWRTGSDFSRAVGGDFDNDGRTDFALFAPWSGDFSVTLSTGTSFGEPTAWGHAAGVGPDGYPYACDTPYAALGAGDFNGDGKLDVSCRRADSGWPLAPSPIFIGLSTGTSFSFSVWNTLGCDAPAFQRTGAIDFDGDGKDDWYCQSAAGHLDVYLSNGSTFNWATFGSLGPSFCGSRYVFGDFNADGRTDAACADNGKVALSTGTRFLEQGGFGAWCAVVPTEEPLSTQVFAADVDGDGASEIVCNNSQAGTTDVQVRKWDGASLGPAETWRASWCEGLLRGGDFDGDGKSDLLCDQLGTPVALAGSAGVRVDLLAHVTNTLGGSLTTAYTPSTQFPNDNNPGPRPVVTALTRDDGRGSVGTSTFAYAGGRIDRERRRFLGFRFVRETKPCLAHETTCPYSEVWLHQDPFVPGRPERVDARQGDGALLSSHRYEYVPSPLTPPYLAQQSGEWSYVYDPSNGGAFKRAYSTRSYDAWGNEVQRTDHGDFDLVGDESTALQTFAVNAAAFLTGLPSSRALRSGIGSGGALLSRVEYGYDGATVGLAPSVGLPTREETWLDTMNANVVTAQRTFDAWGNVTAETRLGGATTTIVFDTTHHLFPTSVTNAVGETVTSGWDEACGVVREATDTNAQVTTTTHDAFCRPLRRDGPLGSFEERSYKDLGLARSQRVQVETPSPVPGAAASLSLEYLDGLGRAWRTVAPGPTAGQEIVSERTYDPRGGLLTRTPPFFSTDPVPTPTRFEYDALGRFTRAWLVDGATVTAAYGAGREAHTDPLGRTTVTSRDARGRTATIEQDDDQGRTLVTRHGYDLRGDLTRFEDAAGNVWTWTYDSLGRLLSRSDPDSGTWTYAYDLASRKSTQTDAKGQVTEEWRDALDRVTQRRTTDDVGRVETVTLIYGEPRAGYFNVGRLTTMTDAQGSARYDYDALGRQVRLLRTLDGTEYVLTQRFDAAGRLLGTTLPDGDTIGTPAGPLQYDAAGRLRAAPGLLNDAVYDAAGRPLSAALANGATNTWAYHARGWTERVRTTLGAATLLDLEYDFDAAGQTTDVASPQAERTWAYEYDALGRLVTADSPLSSLDQTFTYDAVGNVTFNSRVGVYTYPPTGSLRPHAPLTINGQALTYDANGNLLSGRGRVVQWNAGNKPVQINGTQHVYDGEGLRLKKVTGSVATLTPVGGGFEVTGGVATKYATLPGLGLVAKRVGTTPYWLHADRLGSIQAITDATGAAVQSTTYRPYGQKIAEATAHDESRGYIGEIQDDETGLAYLNARYYDPEVGLFLSPDVMSPVEPGVGPNRYAYTAGNPIDYSDPSGMLAIMTCANPQNNDWCQFSTSVTVQATAGLSLAGINLMIDALQSILREINEMLLAQVGADGRESDRITNGRNGLENTRDDTTPSNSVENPPTAGGQPTGGSNGSASSRAATTATTPTTGDTEHCKGLAVSIGANAYAGFGPIAGGGGLAGFVHTPWSSPGWQGTDAGLAFTAGWAQSSPWPPFGSASGYIGVSTSHPAGVSDSWNLMLGAATITVSSSDSGRGFAVGVGPSWPPLWGYHSFDKTTTVGSKGVNGGDCAAP